MNTENCLPPLLEKHAPLFSAGQRRWLALVAATLAYGVANYLSGMNYLPGCSFAELRPQVCLPMFMGLYFGPLFGFVSGALGDSLGYVAAGTNPLPLWHWSLANGLMGLIPGLAASFGVRTVKTLRDMQAVYLLLILAASLPFAFSSFMEYVLGHHTMSGAWIILFLPIFVTDALFAIMIMPLLMLAARLLIVAIPTAIFLLTTYLTSLVVLGTFAVSLGTIWGRSALTAMASRDLYTIGVLSLLVILMGFWLAGIFVRRITHPLAVLAQAADEASHERYDGADQLGELQRRPDELGRLATAFSLMLSAVRARETRLKEEVRQLHIEIDHARQSREVARITGSDYFKNLKNKANELRLKDGP